MTVRFFPLAGALILAGCAVGPNYRQPRIEPAATTPFVEGASSGTLSGRPLAVDWWRLFQDPVLDRLIRDAFAYNTDIRVAEANLRQSRGVLLEQRAGLFPTTTISGGYSHGRVGANNLGTSGGSVSTGTGDDGLGVGGGGTGNGGVGTGNGGGVGGAVDSTTGSDGFTYNYFQAGLDAAYEVDIFGRVRRSIEAARGDFEAQRAALDGVRISISAQVAQNYADACGFAQQADVARETARLQGDTLDLTRRLLDAGRGTRRDVDQAAVLVEQANAQVPQLEAERRAELYAIAALTGRPPSQIDAEAAACRAIPSVKTVIPVGDGATLLARRPDVRQAERTLAADTARIGIATSALFPSVTLNGSVGTGATKFSNLGKSPSFRFSVGPLISWNFPNILVASAQIKEARAGADASLATFQGTILNALRETESALARYAAALDQNAALRRAATAADDAATLSRLRFTSGRDNFLDLLVAERDRANARAALAQSDTRVAENAVVLFKALGGGWENAPPPAYASPAAEPQGVHAAIGIPKPRN